MPHKKKQVRQSNRRLSDHRGGFRLKHYVRLGIGLVVLACLIGLGELVWVSLSHQPFRHVEISSDAARVQVAKLKPLVSSYVTGDFFTLNTSKLQSHLLLLPWVKSVTIRRVWPDKLKVAIHERKAVALWNETQLIDTDGHLFQPPITTYPANLPALGGREKSEISVLHEYNKLVKETEALGLRLVALHLEGDSWVFQLDSGTQVYFNEGEEQQLPGFNQLYRQVLHNKMARVERVDLRYVGGASVRWKKKTRRKYEQ